MAKTVKSLEDYLKKHKAIKGPTSIKSFAEYLESRGENPLAERSDAIKSATYRALFASGRYGTRKDSLERLGLSDDGYGRLLERRAEDKKKAEISAAEAALIKEYSTGQSGYADYVSRYRKAESDKMMKLERHLLNTGIMRLEETYAMGIDYGLSPENAAAVSASVYKALRSDVFDKCITAAKNSYMDESALRKYAEKSGLLPEDIDALVKEARDYIIIN